MFKSCGQQPRNNPVSADCSVQFAFSAGVTGCIGLAHHDIAIAIAGVRIKLEARPAARGPTRPAIGRVFPRRARLQTPDIDRGIAGHSVTRRAGIARQCRRRGRRGRGIDHNRAQLGRVPRIALRIHLSDLNRICRIACPRRQIKARARTRMPGSPAIGRVLPCRIGIEIGCIHQHGRIAGDPITRGSGIVLQRGIDRARLGGIGLHRPNKRAFSAGVACQIGLTHHDIAIGITGIGIKLEARPAARGPTRPAIGRVFPRRARLQTPDIDRGIAGHPVTRRAGIARQRSRGRCRRRHIDRDRAQRCRCAHIACTVDLPQLHRPCGIRARRQVKARARPHVPARPAIGRVLPACSALQTARDDNRAIIGNPVAA